ncbi:MAG: hypothetical protein EA422_03465 [Gemmatimonadales bacterium]|nr:MAG: hypothetical protein EA422_03465 [Gemmatimonadales bacterium]
MSTLVLLVLAGFALVMSPGKAQAQQGTSVEFTEVTSMQAAGFLQLIARRAGGESTHTIHVLGAKMRVDDDDASTIMDAEELRWLLLFHDMEAYMEFGIGDVPDMMAAMEEAMAQAEAELEAELADADMDREELEAAMAEAQATMDVSVEYVNTGESQVINGYAADRHQVIVRVEGAADVEGAEEIEGGALVVVLDMWLSEELARENPLYIGHGDGADNPFVQALLANPQYQEMVDEISAGFEPGNPSSELMVFGMVDPRIGAAMDEAVTQLAELDGMAVRTTSVVALLPPQVELDTELLLAWTPDGMGDQIAGAATEAARQAARDAAAGAARDAIRGAVGGRMGRLARRGGGDDEPEEAEVAEEDLVIQPLLRWNSEVTQVRTVGVPTPDMFVIPAGYRDFSEAMREMMTQGGATGAR